VNSKNEKKKDDEKPTHARSSSVPNLRDPILTERNLPSQVFSRDFLQVKLYPLHTINLKLGELAELAENHYYTEEGIKDAEFLSLPLSNFLY